MVTSVIPSEMLANTANFENSNLANPSIKGNAKVRKPRAKDLWFFTGKARTIFNRQFVKTNDLKWKILDSEFTRSYDREKLFMDYAQQVQRLLDSKRFNDEAKKIGDATDVATHIVFLGKSAMNDVLEYGLSSVIGEKANLFKGSFIDEKTLEIMNLSKSDAQ